MNDRYVPDAVGLRVRPLRDPEPRTAGAATAKVPFVVTLTEATAGRLPAVAGELFIVQDRSGSMSGPKLEACKSAIGQMLNGVSAQNLTVIAHDDSAEVLGRVRDGERAEVERLKRRVKSLTAGGGTRIATALEQVFATEMPAGTARRVIILSDGHTADAAQCRKLADRFGEAEIRIDVLGTDDVDVDLATYLTDRTNGEFAYVNRLTGNEVADFFARGLSGVSNVTVKNVRALFALSPGIALSSLAKAYPDVVRLDAGAAGGVCIGDMQHGEVVRLLGEVTVPVPPVDSVGEVVSVTALFDLPQASLTDVAVTAPLRLAFVAGASPVPDPEVMAAFHSVRAADELTRATQAADPGAALELLASAHRRTTIIGDARKTQVIEGLISEINRTRTFDPSARKTAIAVGRRTQIAS
jgi:hypothetical protein